MEIETGFILLFVVATAVALAVRRVGMPYTRDSQHRLLADIDARELDLAKSSRANDA